MKDPKDIKYETGRYDEEGNPIYITEAEFREHGIYTLQEDEDLDENGNVIKVEPTKVEEEKIRPTLGSVLAGILWFFLIIFFTTLIWAPCGVFFVIGIMDCTTGSIIEGIVICIITGGAILAIFALAIHFAIVRVTGTKSDKPTLSSDKKDPDDISGRYVTFGYTRPNGSKVTYVHKDKD